MRTIDRRPRDLAQTSNEAPNQTSSQAPSRTTSETTTRTGSRWAVLGLLAVTATWGSTFVLLHDATQRIPAADYLTVRFAIAALILIAMRPTGLLRMPKDLLRKGLALGLVCGLGQLLLTVGLGHTSASASGFITGMYVILTPLFAAVLLKQRLGAGVWAGAALATAGLGVISLNGAAIGTGELVTLAGAVFFALHILGLGRWSSARWTIELSALQALVTALVSLPFALPGGIALPQNGSDWAAMLYMGVLVGAVSMVLQTWAQSRIQPSRAAVIMTLEPVWAAVFAVAFGGESFTARLAIGGALVLAAMYLCERVPAEADAAAQAGTDAAGARAHARPDAGDAAPGRGQELSTEAIEELTWPTLPSFSAAMQMRPLSVP